MRPSSRRLLWLAPALLLVAACGETPEPDACENVTCGDNAQCSAGACECDSGFAGDATAGCTAVVACTATSCSGHGTCDASSGAIVCACEAGYAGASCSNCATGFERVNGACVAADACAGLECGDHGSCVVNGDASCECDEGYAGSACSQCDEGYTAAGDLCINEKEVDCVDAAPENATSATGVKVTVTWDATAEAWSTPAACEWECDVDFFETDGGICIDTRTEKCDDTGDLPDNAEFVTGAEVEVSYTTAAGWTSPAACEIRCQADYTTEGGACVNTRLVDCIDPEKPNAEPVPARVTQSWTVAGGWSAAAFCEWTCKADFDDLFDNGECINTADVPCTTDGTLPGGAEWVDGTKTITYTTAGGWTSSTCSFTCGTGTGPTEAGSCDAEQDVVCTSAPPENATTTDAQALVTVTWNDATQRWSTPGTCPWACNDGYDDFEGAGVCINERTVACVTPDDLPDGAEIIPGDVTITFTDGAWPTPTCDWQCDAEHGPVGDECLSWRWVPCDPSQTPANARVYDYEVNIWWDFEAQAWTLPEMCEYECNEGYGYVDADGSCANTAVVPCASPDNSVGVGENATVVITYTDEAGWSEPEACDEWACIDGYLRSGDECVERAEVTSCRVNPPSDVFANDAITLRSTANGRGVVTGHRVQLLGRICYATAPLVAPVDPAAMTCVDAGTSWENFEARFSVESPGDYGYVALVSGDLGATWTICGLDGTLDDVATPGTMQVLSKPSFQLDRVRRAVGSSTNLLVEGATVTYVRPAVGDDEAGFFVQGDPLGPAVFVAYAGTDLAAGDVVSFRAGQVARTSGNVVYVKAFTHLQRIGVADVATLVQGLTDAADLVSAIGDYESEIVSITGDIAGPFAASGAGHLAAPLHTAGLQSESLELRLPEALVASAVLMEGCRVTVTGPMWRNNEKAQPSVYVAEDLEADCPGPRVTAVEGKNLTTVALTFDRDINPEWVVDAGYHFAIEPPLELVDMEVVGNRILLRTGVQAEHTTYGLTIRDLYDLAGRGLAEDPTIVDFRSHSVCGWDGTGSAVVISQVYGGGGDSGAPYRNDFVELFNRSDEEVSLTDLAIHLSSTGGLTWSKVLLAGTVPAGGFYLIKLKGGQDGATLPEADVEASTNMATTTGNIALTNASAALSICSTGAQFMDLMGYGAGNCNEGAAKAPTGSVSMAVGRKDVCVDTDQNGDDFQTMAPQPRRGVQ